MTSEGPIAGEQQIQLQKPHPLIPRLGVILDHATYNSMPECPLSRVDLGSHMWLEGPGAQCLYRWSAEEPCCPRILAGHRRERVWAQGARHTGFRILTVPL